jgi:hypothetical protein
VHESIGHLGIFVSGSVAKKEHDEFASNIDLIDVLPPGLYEAVMTPKDTSDPNAELVGGGYLVKFEARTLDDIRALGGNTPDDERKFAAAARISEINLGLYKTFLQPWVRLWANEGLADWLQKMHPARLQYEMLSRENPMLRSLDALVDIARENRQPVAEDNIFWHAQRQFSDRMVDSLNAYRDVRDKLQEEWFHAFYGSPLLQAMVGLNGSETAPRRKPGDDATYRAFVKRRIDELKRDVTVGGPLEGAIRALLYVRMPEGAVDERSFNFIRQLRDRAGGDRSLADFKQLLREQFFMLILDERRAVDAIPEMLARNPALAVGLGATFKKIIDIVGLTSEVSRARLAEMDRLFAGVEEGDEGVRPIRAHATRGSKL